MNKELWQIASREYVRFSVAQESFKVTSFNTSRPGNDNNTTLSPQERKFTVVTVPYRIAYSALESCDPSSAIIGAAELAIKRHVTDKTHEAQVESSTEREIINILGFFESC